MTLVMRTNILKSKITNTMSLRTLPVHDSIGRYVFDVFTFHPLTVLNTTKLINILAEAIYYL